MKIDCLFKGIHIGNRDTQKNQLLRVFFCAKNDESENCQQRKALTSHPIRIAQFHEKSFFKSTKDRVKSSDFEQASVGVTFTSFINFLENCFVKNRKKQCYSCKAPSGKMSPPKPNPTHLIRAFRFKKLDTFSHFSKHERYGDRAQIKAPTTTTTVAPDL